MCPQPGNRFVSFVRACARAELEGVPGEAVWGWRVLLLLLLRAVFPAAAAAAAPPRRGRLGRGRSNGRKNFLRADAREYGLKIFFVHGSKFFFALTREKQS